MAAKVLVAAMVVVAAVAVARKGRAVAAAKVVAVIKRPVHKVHAGRRVKVVRGKVAAAHRLATHNPIATRVVSLVA